MFVVNGNATKHDVRKAVEELYGVKVDSVNIMLFVLAFENDGNDATIPFFIAESRVPPCRAGYHFDAADRQDFRGDAATALSL